MLTVNNIYGTESHRPPHKLSRVNKNTPWWQLPALPDPFDYSALGFDLHHRTKKLLMTIEKLVKEKITEDSDTQIRIAQGNKGLHWCAYTASYILRENGVKIPVMPCVNQFVDWGRINGRYSQLSCEELSPTNYKKQVPAREQGIKSQIQSMCIGDLIVWKSNCLKATDKNNIASEPRSHIGIVTNINVVEGKITVAEGNANINETKTIDDISGIMTDKKLNGKDRLMKKNIQYT